MSDEGYIMRTSDDLQEMLIEKYLFTKAPPGPHHNDYRQCIDCKVKLERKYDYYPY